MGYYTMYSLEIKGNYEEEKVIEALCENLGADCYEYVKLMLEGSAWEAKWYDCSEDLIKVSKKFPDLIFALEGEGEERFDNWIEYFKNGKSHYIKPLLPVFDESKLV